MLLLLSFQLMGKKTLNDGSSITVESVLYQDYAGGIHQAAFCLNPVKLSEEYLELCGDGNFDEGEECESYEGLGEQNPPPGDAMYKENEDGSARYNCNTAGFYGGQSLCKLCKLDTSKCHICSYVDDDNPELYSDRKCLTDNSYTLCAYNKAKVRDFVGAEIFCKDNEICDEETTKCVEKPAEEVEESKEEQLLPQEGLKCGVEVKKGDTFVLAGENWQNLGMTIDKYNSIKAQVKNLDNNEVLVYSPSENDVDVTYFILKYKGFSYTFESDVEDKIDDFHLVSPCKAECGNGKKEEGETCDGRDLGDLKSCEEQAAPADYTMRCFDDCATYGCADLCGNGKLEGDEACDDGNKNSWDGCSSSCDLEDGWKVVPCPKLLKLESKTCFEKAPAVCGNGLKAPLEQCDDGNLKNGDGCSSLCKIEKPDLIVESVKVSAPIKLWDPLAKKYHLDRKDVKVTATVKNIGDGLSAAFNFSAVHKLPTVNFGQEYNSTWVNGGLAAGQSLTRSWKYNCNIGKNYDLNVSADYGHFVKGYSNPDVHAGKVKESKENNNWDDSLTGLTC